jgi:hypothetical protein
VEPEKNGGMNDSGSDGTGDLVSESRHDGALVLSDDRRRSRGKMMRRLASTIGFVVAALIVVVAIFALRLSQGPVALPFLTDTVLHKIGGKMPPGMTFSLADVSIERHDGALALVLDEPSLARDGGQPFFSSVSIHIGVDLMDLLGGTATPTSVELRGPRIALARLPDGHLSLRDAPLPDTTRTAGLGIVLAAFDTALGAVPTVSEFKATDVIVLLDSVATQSSQVFDPFDLTMRRTGAPGGLSIVATSDGSSRLTMTSERREDGARYVEINGRDLSPRLFGLGLTPSGPPPDIVGGINGIGTARIGADGLVLAGSLSLHSDGGMWRVGPNGTAFGYDEAAIDLKYAGSEIVVERLAIRAGAGAAQFKGRIIPPADPMSTTDAIWRMVLESGPLTLAGPQDSEPPLLLDSATIVAHYDPTNRLVGLDRASFAGPSAGLEVQGSMTFGPKAPGIGLAFVGTSMPVSAFKRFWPFFAAVEARAWFARNVTGGRIESATLKIAIPLDALSPVDGVVPPLPDDAVAGRLVFEDTTVSMIRTMPPLTKARAVATATGRTFTVALDSAEIVVGDDIIAVTDGRYEIPHLEQKPSPTTAQFRLTGPARGIATLMRLEPLAGATKDIAFDPSTVTGSVALDVRIDAPLVDQLSIADIDYRVTGTVEKMTVSGFNGAKLENLALDVDLEPGRVAIEGNGRLSGIPATIAMERRANTPQALKMSLTVDDAVRAKMGFPHPEKISGPISVDVDLSNPDQARGLDVKVDLTQARIDDFIPGWQKTAGKPATLGFRFVSNPKGGGTLADIQLSAGTVDVRGEATLGANGLPTNASFSPFRIQPDDSAKVELSSNDKGLRIDVSGKSLDVRGALKTLLRGGAAKNNIVLSVSLDRAPGFNDEAVDSLRLNLTVDGGAIRQLAATGQLGDAPASVDLGKGDGGKPLVQLNAANAGAFLRFLNYYSKVRGGRIDARITPDLNAATGVVFMRDFAVRGEPAIAQFFSSARPIPNNGDNGRELVPRANAQSDARFTKLRLAFSRTPKRLVIDDGVIWGPEVGASISGEVNYAADTLNITGTFVPAYALNNLFGQIPILGILLGGGQYGGLFAITFRVAGPIASPTLTVNPLSGIAPGILRKLFEFQKQ